MTPPFTQSLRPVGTLKLSSFLLHPLSNTVLHLNHFYFPCRPLFSMFSITHRRNRTSLWNGLHVLSRLLKSTAHTQVSQDSVIGCVFSLESISWIILHSQNCSRYASAGSSPMIIATPNFCSKHQHKITRCLMDIQHIPSLMTKT